MAKEIERKFLVKSEAFRADSVASVGIMQSYFADEAHISIFASIDKGYVEIDSQFGNWAIGINSVEAAEIKTIPREDLTIRLRLMYPGDSDVYGFLTIKGKSTDDGLERDEWEYPVSQALYLDIARTLKLRTLVKTRFYCPLGKLTIEVDEFSTGTDMVDGELTCRPPFHLAEIEFPVGYDHSQPLTLPEWVGEEVTGNVEYYNSVLIKSGKIRVGVVHKSTNIIEEE